MCIARADLEDVGVAGHFIDVPFAQHFGDDLEAGFLFRQREQAQAFLAESLELVGRSAGLERAAAQDGSARGFHGARGGEELFFALDGARTRHEAERCVAADLEAIDVDRAVLGMRFAADELVPLLDGDDLFDLRQGVQRHRACGA